MAHIYRREHSQMDDQFERAGTKDLEQTVIAYNSIPRAQLAPGAMSHIFAGRNMTLSFADLEAGSYFPVHTHDFEQIMLVLEGELDAILDGKLYHMRPGDVIHFPEGHQHGAKMNYGNCRIVDMFSPARADYEEKMRQAMAGSK